MSVPANIETGWAVLERHPCFKAISDWQKETNDDGLTWIRKLEVKSSTSSQFIPEISHWWLRVSNCYPHGVVRFLPDVGEQGLSVTFQHQHHNALTKNGKPYRTGDTCLTFPGDQIAKLSRGITPINSYERLWWFGERLLEWIAAANLGTLAVDGDPFELPALPDSLDDYGFAFHETPERLASWNNMPISCGSVELALLDNHYFPLTFHGTSKEVAHMRWGHAVLEAQTKRQAVWFHLDRIPVEPPWGWPTRTQGLERLLSEQGIDLASILRIHREAVLHTRTRDELLVLLGFPIPKTIGAPDHCLCWQAVTIEIARNQPVAHLGTNPKKRHAINLKQAIVLRDCPLKWHTSANFAPEEFSSRGRLSPTFAESRVVLVGAGSLGSALGEALVRAGVMNIRIIDHETLVMRNLVRHQLLMSDTSKSKAKRLAQRLNRVNPHVEAKGAAIAFPPDVRTEPEKWLEEADIILDVTADNAVARAMSRFQFAAPKRFAVLTLGWRARSLHAFTLRGKRFYEEQYQLAIDPRLELETDWRVGDELPWEGIGCHHPVFPARYDDVQMLAMIAVKWLEEQLTNDQAVAFTVFEQVEDAGRFIGIRREDIL